MRDIKLNRNQLKTVLKEQYLFFKKQDLGIEREKLKDVLKYSRGPQIVVISGLRRVGKSTLLAQIRKRKYQNNFYYLNFEDERLLNFQAQDFSLLHQLLLEMFGEKRTFFLDEVQNIPGWERFVRRLSDRGYKFYLTGSNASLLSQELGSKLTGRYALVELFPFSFKEYLIFKKEKIVSGVLTTKEKANLKRHFNHYLLKGGIADALKYPQLNIHQQLYQDIIHRDIVARYKIEAVKSLKDLAFYLMSNNANLISFNKLKALLKLGSVNTVSTFIDHLQMAWLFFTLNIYSFSVKKQQIAPKKIYGIDTGMVNAVGFAFSKNKGRLLENLVYLVLREKQKQIFYYKTKKGQEIDFYLPGNKLFIQVAQEIESSQAKEREIAALAVALKEVKGSRGLILTEDREDELRLGRKKIKVVPIYNWILGL